MFWPRFSIVVQHAYFIPADGDGPVVGDKADRVEMNTRAKRG
jgi:hypothetical protein